MRTILFILGWSVVCIHNCNNIKRDSNSQIDKINMIKIINRTENKYVKTNTILTDARAISDFEEQFKSMKKVNDQDIKDNFGFFEMQISYADGKNEDWGVIYTVFDGVVIINNNTNLTYKDNYMESLILHYLQKN